MLLTSDSTPSTIALVSDYCSPIPAVRSQYGPHNIEVRRWLMKVRFWLKKNLLPAPCQMRIVAGFVRKTCFIGALANLRQPYCWVDGGDGGSVLCIIEGEEDA